MRNPIKRALLCFTAGVLVVFASACDLTDLNEDPNNPTAVPENLQLPGLLSNFSYRIVANQAARIPAQWVQQLAWAGVYPSASTYDVNESTVNNLWEFWGYPNIMNNARILSAQATENGNPAYAGIAKVIEAWTLGVMTDLFGDIPYSEAFDPLNQRPRYDTQQEIYNNIFRLLDEAVLDLQATQNNLLPGTGQDLVFGGNRQRWIQLAYSLKAQFKLRLSNAPGHSETAQAQEALAALANGFQSNADNARYLYYNSPGAENPWFQFAIDGKWDTRDVLSATYVNMLKTLRDPRLPIHARPVGAVVQAGLAPGFQTPPFTEAMFDLEDPTYRGQVVAGGAGAGTAANSAIGAFFSAPNAPLWWLTYASQKFVEAEATLITSGAAAAQPIFEAAIRADMQRLNVDEAQANAYIASLPRLTDAGASPRQLIITQKYIANFLHLEPYNDFRRTGYPALSPVAASEARRIDIIPLRFPYPSSERARNAANIPSYVPVGFDAMRVPVWWDTTVPAGALPNPTQ